MVKKICLFTIVFLFYLSARSFAEVGLSIKAQGTYGILLKPDIQELGLPEEKLTKGGLTFSGQLLYRPAGEIVSFGVEVGYIDCWRDAYTDPGSGERVEINLSAVPILAIIQLESRLPYLQIGAGLYRLTSKIAVLSVDQKRRDTRLGLMFAAGAAIPLDPKLNLDLGGKLHMILTEDESTILLSPALGILLRF